MLIVLSIYYLACQSVQALPIPSTELYMLPSCNDLHQCRTVWDISWSCLVTVFACTWIAIHPNIPDPDKDSWHQVALRRLGLMVMAVIAPELTVLWAMRQQVVANKFVEKYRKYNWTQTHGFFALMGGFMLYDGDKPVRVLRPKELKSLTRRREIHFPCINEDEIQDKSKGDMLTKGLVVVQTGWFVMQCIARHLEHLRLTELELVTLAFAMLNFCTYWMWWNKPLNVQRAFRVPKRQQNFNGGGGHGQDANREADHSEEDEDDCDSNSESDCDCNCDCDCDSSCNCNCNCDSNCDSNSNSNSDCECECDSYSNSNSDCDGLIRHLSAVTNEVLHNVRVAMGDVVRGAIAIVHKLPSAAREAMCAIEDVVGFIVRKRSVTITLATVGHGVEFIFWHLVGTFNRMGYGEGMKKGAKSVPAFYPKRLKKKDGWIGAFFGLAISMFFGGIHCIAWSFQFPSLTEQRLWQISSLSITFTPVIIFGLTAPGWRDNYRLIDVLFFLLYIPARVVLVVLAFIALRSLPPDAYRDVSWTNFIPHV